MMKITIDCTPVELSDDNLIADFDCGDSDLNDFFNNDAILFRKQRLGQTHFFCHQSTGKIVCAFSLSADSVKTQLLPGSRRKQVVKLLPREKSLQSYPALLIGRLGVSTDFGGQGIGTQLLKFIKGFCSSQYMHIARFLVVDAYNNPNVLNFYQKNGFGFVFSTEQQERENLRRGTDESQPLHTRQMFYDLMRFCQED